MGETQDMMVAKAFATVVAEMYKKDKSLTAEDIIDKHPDWFYEELTITREDALIIAESAILAETMV